MLHVPKVGARDEPAAAPPVERTVPLIQPGDIYTLKLHTSLPSHKGEIKELKFRKPTASDYIEIGSIPFKVVGEMSEHRHAMIDFKMAGRWIEKLTGLDAIITGMLSGRDFLQAVGHVNAILMTDGLGDDVGN
jgi:hypothetical protein